MSRPGSFADQAQVHAHEVMGVKEPGSMYILHRHPLAGEHTHDQAVGWPALGDDVTPQVALSAMRDAPWDHRTTSQEPVPPRPTEPEVDWPHGRA